MEADLYYQDRSIYTVSCKQDNENVMGSMKRVANVCLTGFKTGVRKGPSSWTPRSWILSLPVPNEYGVRERAPIGYGSRSVKHVRGTIRTRFSKGLIKAIKALKSYICGVPNPYTRIGRSDTRIGRGPIRVSDGSFKITKQPIWIMNLFTSVNHIGHPRRHIKLATNATNFKNKFIAFRLIRHPNLDRAIVRAQNHAENVAVVQLAQLDLGVFNVLITCFCT